MKDYNIYNVEDLQTELEGVFDFNKTDDCKKLINTLLKSLGTSRTVYKDLNIKLKNLSLEVVGGNHSEAIQTAQEYLSGHVNPKMNIYEYLQFMFNSNNSAEGLSDADLYEEILDKIYSNLDVASYESALLSELIKRIKNTSYTVSQ